MIYIIAVALMLMLWGQLWMLHRLHDAITTQATLTQELATLVLRVGKQGEQLERVDKGLDALDRDLRG